MTSQGLWIVIFWLSLAAVTYTYVGYPSLLVVLSRLPTRRRLPSERKATPFVTVVLAACNEEQRIVGRLANLLAANYPCDQLRIVVVSDGSTDGTVESIRTLNEPRIQLVARPDRSGKASCLNAALAEARSDLVVFADARQRFEPDTISKLAAHFGDPTVGAVSGELVVDASASAVGGGVDAYWRLEKKLRRAEAQFDSCIGCTGAVYAIRRELFRPLPPDTILDDVVIPMQIAMLGFRVAFEPAAVARDPQRLEPEREKVRKRRTLAGNYQMLFRYPAWLLPWHNRLWWQLLSHKYLRLAAPWLLLGMFVANAALIHAPLYRALFLGQCFFYALALTGIAFRGLRFFLFSVPAGFVFLNAMAASALWHYLFVRDVWQVTRDVASSPVANHAPSNHSHV